MTTIRQQSSYATLINVFTVEPEKAADLAGLLTSATENVMQHQPGFRSANIHLSTDRTRVVNYAQWDSPQAYEKMLEQTSTEHAPWYVVPADHNWVRNLAVARILLHTLEGMDPQFPEPEEGLEDIVVT